MNDHPLRPAFRNVPCSRPAAPNVVAAAFLTLQTRPLQLTVAAAGRGRAPTSLQIRANTFDKNCWPRHAPICSIYPLQPARTRKGYLMHPQPWNRTT